VKFALKSFAALACLLASLAVTWLVWELAIDGSAFRCTDAGTLSDAFWTSASMHESAGDQIAPGWTWEKLAFVNRLYKVAFFLLWIGGTAVVSRLLIGLTADLSQEPSAQPRAGGDGGVGFDGADQHQLPAAPQHGRSASGFTFLKMHICFPLLLWLTASAAQPADNEFVGDEFVGVGLVLKEERQNIVINRILPDTPAASQKELHVGDRIVAVAQDKEPAVQVTNIVQAARAMRGPKGTIVRLRIIPAGEDDSHAEERSFVRGEVKPPWGDGLLLATGTKAPDIEMVDVENKASERLSNYDGKIIILEFWATWCGPCQAKMAKLQTYPGEYRDWTTNVELIAASIDVSAEIAAKHLKAKGWDQTHNVWVEVPAIRAYHIDAIPTVYVIDREGKILAANPRDLPQAVNHELEEKRAADAK